MTNEWTRAQDKVIEMLKEETLARIKRHYNQTEGDVLDAEETYERAGEQFVRGIQYLIDDMKERVVEDIEQIVKDWTKDL